MPVLPSTVTLISLHCNGITILVFSAEISFDLNKFCGQHISKGHSSLTSEHGKYFELNADFHFDHGHRW